jgi:hypothetical protein
MHLAVALFGLFVAALGLAGVLSPRRLLALVTHAVTRLGIYFLAAFRLVAGTVLLVAAASSRAPLYLQILGWLSLVAGAITPFVGVRRVDALLDWWRRRPAWIVRLWSCFVVLFGVSLVWAVLPVQRTASL